MAKAYKCDRCGKYYDRQTVTYNDDPGRTAQEGDHFYKIIRSFAGYGPRADESVDLCPECLNDFHNFLKNKEAEDDE